MRSLIELQGDHHLSPEARKLLSFTDNRQDASLQAGHFNDFVQIALLRSALHKATQNTGANGLKHGELSGKVFDAMQLPYSTLERKHEDVMAKAAELDIGLEIRGSAGKGHPARGRGYYWHVWK